MRQFGVVGTAGIGEFHAQALKGIGVPLVACYDIVSDRAEAFAREHDCTPYSDLEQFLAHPGLDVVTIGTPSGTHGEIAIAAARAAKHVVTEKPLEITVERCDAMIREARESGVQLACIFQNRFADGVRAAQLAVREGWLGRLIMANVRVLWYRSQEYFDTAGWRGTWELDGGGSLMNQGIHYLDMLLHLAGPVRALRGWSGALGHRIETEDVNAAALEFESGAVGTLSVTTCAYPGLEAAIELIGETGTVVVENQEIRRWEFMDSHPGPQEIIQHQSQVPPAIAEALRDKPWALHARQFHAIHEALERGLPAPVTGEEARRPVQLIRAVYESSETGETMRLDEAQ